MHQRERKLNFMKKMTIVTILIGLFVGGCGNGYYWYKKGGSIEQAEADCVQCYLDSMSQRMSEQHDGRQDAQVTHTAYIPEAENPFGNQLEDIAFNNCMKGKGYREVSGEFLNPSLRKKSCSPTPESCFFIAGQ